MILRQIVLNDFRQFAGRQAIVFASPDGTGDPNVTVIFGENGRGKTGLYRAMLFALFGDIRLNQDDDTVGSELRLVNANKLSESRDGQVVEASVELSFDHMGKMFTLIRKRRGIRKHGDKIVEEAGAVQLQILLPDHNTLTIDDRDEIQKEISGILDPRVKDYYLFDGERMDRLTRAGASQRREVAKGIRSLLNIDDLENAHKAMDRATKKLSFDLDQASSVDYARVLSEIETCRAQAATGKLRIDEIDRELGLADEEINRIDRLLGDFQEIKGLVQRRTELAQRMELRTTERKTCGLNLCNSVSRAAMLLVRPTVTGIYNEIATIRRRGELPAEIRRDLIERVLERDECICGRPVLDDSRALAAVREWLDKTASEAIEDSALLLWQSLSGIISHLDDYESEIQSNLQLFGNASNDIAEYARQLSEIKEKIGNSERRDAGELEDVRSQASNKVVSLTADRKLEEIRLKEIRVSLERLDVQKQDEAAKQSKKDEFTLRVDLSRRVTDALEDVVSRFTGEIRERLSQLASIALDELLDHAGKAHICKVRVGEDYTIEVFNRFDEPWLAQISAGQRQVLSIAFVAALAEAASNGRLLEMPLFMDTPFGRLGSAHRENLMKLVPIKAAQWILLATDTEFRSDEATLLQGTQRWGKLYFLDQNEEGDTVIREKEPTQMAFTAYVSSRGKS